MEEQAMSDFVSGIKHIGPSYPVKPVQPAQKDRETGNRRKKRPSPATDTDKRDDDDQEQHIDEHV